ARRAGTNFAHAELMFWFHMMEIVVPGSTYWNIAYGREKGEVQKDEEGLKTAWNFGKNLAWLTKKINS
ncbi:flavodoxin family protein, partial [Chloroflexota bacterium]